MLQETLRRLDGIEGIRYPLIVCSTDHRFLIAEQLRQVRVQPAAVVLEPVGRNTAPAAAVAALLLLEQDPNAVMLLLPSDHSVGNVSVFHRAVGCGMAAVGQGHLVCFGIEPHAPETGFGYVERGESLQHFAGDNSVHRVAGFIEKPDADRARELLSLGKYCWNSGMFLFSCRQYIDELARFNPAMVAACHKALEGRRQDLDFCRLDKVAFADCPADSIDYAVMERTDRAAVVTADMGWHDIGTWSALWDVCQKDAGGNVTRGDVWLSDTTNSLVRSEKRLVAAVGVENLVIVETADAVLVAHKSRSQDVKKLVADLQAAGRVEHLLHTRVHRPWGWYEGVDCGDRFQVKRLAVKPGESLSLQMHHHRNEHWIVVKGTAQVTLGDREFSVNENESTYIPSGSKHRLMNPGRVMLEMIEVQSGSYLGEDDIVRFDDVYGRVG